MCIALMFGDDEYITEESETVKVNYVSSVDGVINLGDVKIRDINDYTGKPYKGYDDPLQQEMARELLDLYKEVVQKQATLVQSGISTDKLVEFLLGVHLAESDTYTGKSLIKSVDVSNDTEIVDTAVSNTLIPVTMVGWDTYGIGVTATGDKMNFRNYSWRDFNQRYSSDNPNNEFTGISNKQAKYFAGFNYYAMRSYTGAINSFQYQPVTWSNNDYVQKTVNDVRVDYISDIENYVKSSTGRPDFNGDGFSDIYNLGDQALATLKGFSTFFEDGSVPTKTGKVPKTDSKLMAIWHAVNHNTGNTKQLEKNPDMFNSDIQSIIYDEELFIDELLPYYEKANGHGTGDYNIFVDKMISLGWMQVVEGQYTWLVKEDISIREDVIVYALRTHFKGKAWYLFLQGIAYGNQSQGQVGQLGRNKVWYNYMTGEDSKRKLDDGVRTNAIDKRMALGYKGNIPIYDQAGSFMKKYAMLYDGNKWSFNGYGCTVFTLASMHYSTGNNLTPLHSAEMDINDDAIAKKGYIDPIELWGMGRGYINKDIRQVTPYQLRSANLDVPIGTVSIRSLATSVGYVVESNTQGYEKDDRKKILKQIREGIPTHIRVDGGKSIASALALVPNIPQDEINYATFDLKDINNYDINNPTKVNLAQGAGVHSILGVDAISVNDKWYVGIVNSVSSHAPNEWDTNLLWFDFNDLLKMYYTGGYAIVGSVQEEWKPIYMSEGSVSDTIGDTYIYEGIDYSVALDRINDCVLGIYNNMTMTAKSNTEDFVTIKGKYKTEKVNEKTLRLYVGESGELQYALEFTNITDAQSSSVVDVDSEEVTNLFKIKSGTQAFIKKLVIDSKGTVSYETFFDKSN